MPRAALKTRKPVRKAAARRTVKKATRKLVRGAATNLFDTANRKLALLSMLPGAELEGGVFAGLTYRDGKIEALILGPEYDGTLTHSKAVEWAAGLKVNGFTDWTLLDRVGARVCMANVSNLFKPEWHWLLEQPESNSGYAWGQDFSDGFQDHWRKDHDHRARAVRRLAI
jgi:hypothetical protein